MARILCTHSNASSNINGIPFEKDERGQWMSVHDVPLEKALPFESIPHFKVIRTARDEPVVAAPAGMVTLYGPKGEIQVAGALSRADIDALQAHWDKGSIMPPMVPVPPAPMVEGTEGVGGAVVETGGTGQTEMPAAKGSRAGKAA